MKYHITTFGCQANEADSEKITGILENMGYRQALEQNSADVLIINTCSVRQSAEDRVFGLNKKLRELKIARLAEQRRGRKTPKLKIVLTGCMTHYPKEKLKKRLPYIDIFLPIKDLSRLPALLNNKNRGRASIFPKYQFAFRAYIPISEGCDNFCSYCIVPFARGKEVSRPAEEIVCEAERLIKAGYKEIWLIGQNVNSYKSVGIWLSRPSAAERAGLLWYNGAERLTTTERGEDISEASALGERAGLESQISKRSSIHFSGLLKIINAIPGNFWLRFTSPHPQNFSDDLIWTMAESEKFAHYVNLPVQSGDNEILKKMRRSYTIEQYKELVNKIRTALPDIALSTDVIVGFPGETEEQFENTCRLMEEIKFDMAYISQYSPRPKTAASRMKDDVPKEEKKRREKILTEILKKTALENNQRYVGKTEEVLIEKEKNVFLIGKNKAHKTVKIPPPPFFHTLKNESKINGSKIIGQFKMVKIKKAREWGLEGE